MTTSLPKPKSTRNSFAILWVLGYLVLCTFPVSAETTNSTRMPPLGIAVPAEIRAELSAGVADLGHDLDDLKHSLQSKPELLDLLPDAQIYYNAVRYALEDDLFYKTNDFATARKFLAQGRERARELRNGRAPWTNATGLVVRGYVSRIDHSVQPYGLVVPVSYHPGATNQHRLDFWFHGRGNELSELAFINDRQNKTGEFAPTNTFVLHPYGRYCNAYKFAGEVDVFEALENVERHYPIDTNRISVRGFSMGGAATWHIAAHHAGLWAAASPGAGFVETPIYTKASRREVPWYEQKLWRLYDAADYAGNLFNTHVIAYSGEIDPQKQAADLMAAAMAKEGLTLTHIIGPKTAHKYEPKAKEQVARLVDAAANAGRNPLPREIHFTTWTLRYNQMDWVTIDGLERHWERARVDAEIIENKKIRISTTNVSALNLEMVAGLCPFKPGTRPTVTIDGQDLIGASVNADRSWSSYFGRNSSTWMWTAGVGRHGLPPIVRKVHGLQGPIDDAFTDSFIFVRPTGNFLNDTIGAWVTNSLTNAIVQWRLQFRGEPQVKDDTDITTSDIESNNLILWGDPKSNKLLARVAPFGWDSKTIHTWRKTYSSDNHVPIAIYPNPLLPADECHYVVINSGFTFSEVAHLSNALQTPKLPDYAIIDITAPPVARVVEAGFFNEHWELPNSLNP